MCGCMLHTDDVHALCTHTKCHHVHNQWKTRHILSEVHINKQINHKPRCHGNHRKIYHIYKLKEESSRLDQEY